MNNEEFQEASLTFYNSEEDEFGWTTARRNEVGDFKAVHGRTIAVDPAIIPYGSKVYIPELEMFSLSGDGVFYAHDTGSAVVKRVASKAKGNENPVIDAFANVPLKYLNKLNDIYGETVKFKIIEGKKYV